MSIRISFSRLRFLTIVVLSPSLGVSETGTPHHIPLGGVVGVIAVRDTTQRGGRVVSTSIDVWR